MFETGSYVRVIRDCMFPDLVGQDGIIEYMLDEGDDGEYLCQVFLYCGRTEFYWTSQLKIIPE